MARRKKKTGKSPVAKAPESDGITWVTPGEFALHRSLGIQAVYAYLRRGRIPGVIRDGHKYINRELADKILDALPPQKSRQALDEIDASGVTPQETYAGNRAKRERFEMELKRVAYEQKIGKLIDKAKVERAAYEVARVTRDSLLAVPDRIAAEVAAESDPQKVHFMITEALLAALNHGLNDPLKGIENLEADGSSQALYLTESLPARLVFWPTFTKPSRLTSRR